MKNRLLILLILAMTITSCVSSKKSASKQLPTTTFPAAVPKPTDDGLSYATAIVITETSETTGVKAEYKWIKEHYSNYTIKGQQLSYKDKKPYDIITISLESGKELSLYFDISNFFGKF
ncbi:MAG: hypothetical protein QM725_00980 [Lacibacter sp.]